MPISSVSATDPTQPASQQGQPISSVTTPASTQSASSPGQLSSNDFLNLLIAQIQSQDPLNPLDPNQFVTQLVQFNSLEQLIAIHQLLQSNSAGSSTGVATNQLPAGF